MIKINLLKKKKRTHIPIVMGMDVNNINPRLIIFSIFIIYSPDIILVPILEGKNKTIQTAINEDQKKLDQLIKEVESSKKLLHEIAIYKRREKKFKEIDDLANDLVKRKNSPHKILLRMARSIPKDLWLDHLAIDSNKKILIKGGSLAYKSVGSFVSLMNESIFFDKSLDVVNLKTVDDDLLKKGNRMETFEIKGEVKVFDVEDNK